MSSYFFFFPLDSACLTAIVVMRTVSGISEIESIFSRARNCAKSGKSEGACPQMPILRLFFFAAAITVLINVLTAS